MLFRSGGPTVLVPLWHHQGNPMFHCCDSLAPLCCYLISRLLHRQSFSQPQNLLLHHDTLCPKKCRGYVPAMHAKMTERANWPQCSRLCRRHCRHVLQEGGVATVEHGVPLMMPKWDQHPWFPRKSSKTRSQDRRWATPSSHEDM